MKIEPNYIVLEFRKLNNGQYAVVLKDTQHMCDLDRKQFGISITTKDPHEIIKKVTKKFLDSLVKNGVV